MGTDTPEYRRYYHPEAHTSIHAMLIDSEEVVIGIELWGPEVSFEFYFNGE